MAKIEAQLAKDGAVEMRRSGRKWERVQPRADWSRVDATGEAEINRQATEDEAEALRDAADWVRRVRRRTRLSQSEFARRIGVSSATLRAWEHGVRPPAGAARALLRVIDQIPEAALAVLVA